MYFDLGVLPSPEHLYRQASGCAVTGQILDDDVYVQENVIWT